jgi:hypothetical protein
MDVSWDKIDRARGAFEKKESSSSQFWDEGGGELNVANGRIRVREKKRWRDKEKQKEQIREKVSPFRESVRERQSLNVTLSPLASRCHIKVLNCCSV